MFVLLVQCIMGSGGTRSRSYDADVRGLGRVQQLTGPKACPMGRPMPDRSAVGQLSSLSSRTKWQRLSAGDTLYVFDSRFRTTSVT